jgi:hypothetical protein
MRQVYLSLFVVSFFLSLTVFAQTFRSVPLPDSGERVTGIFCTSTTSCLIATDGAMDLGHVYLTDGQTITATPITGDYEFAQGLGTLGIVNFMGFSHLGEDLIVHIDGAGNALVTADVSKLDTWTADTLGIPDGSSSFGANQQIGFGMKEGRWVYFRRATIYETTDAPGPGALWFPIWSPSSPGEIPSNFLELYKNDPKLCAAEPSVSISPKLTQAGYVAPDLSVILYPAGSRNQNSTAGPGVCLSTDGGQRFFHIAFADIPDDLGPLGVGCASDNLCFAYGGLEYEPDSVYIYVTKDAQKGVDSSWVRATLPALKEDSRFRSMAFSSDGFSGWAVGASGSSSSLVLTSSDGGATWTDQTSVVRALAPDSRLHTVYVFSNEHVWIGGENGVLLTSGE